MERGICAWISGGWKYDTTHTLYNNWFKPVKDRIKKFEFLYTILGFNGESIFSGSGKPNLKYVKIQNTPKLIALVNYFHNSELIMNPVIDQYNKLSVEFRYGFRDNNIDVDVLFAFEDVIQFFIKRYWSNDQSAFQSWLDNSLDRHFEMSDTFRDLNTYIPLDENFFSKLDFDMSTLDYTMLSGIVKFRQEFSYTTPNSPIRSNKEFFLSPPEKINAVAFSSCPNVILIGGGRMMEPYFSSIVRPTGFTDPFTIINPEFPVGSSNLLQDNLHTGYTDGPMVFLAPIGGGQYAIRGVDVESLGGGKNREQYRWRKTIKTPHAILLGQAPLYIAMSDSELHKYLTFSDTFSKKGKKYEASIGVIAPAITRTERDKVLIPLLKLNPSYDLWGVITHLADVQADGVTPVLDLHGTRFVDSQGRIYSDLVKEFQARFGIVINNGQADYIKVPYTYIDRNTGQQVTRDDWWEIWWYNYMNKQWLLRDVFYDHWELVTWVPQFQNYQDLVAWLDTLGGSERRRDYSSSKIS